MKSIIFNRQDHNPSRREDYNPPRASAPAAPTPKKPVRRASTKMDNSLAPSNLIDSPDHSSPIVDNPDRPNWRMLFGNLLRDLRTISREIRMLPNPGADYHGALQVIHSALLRMEQAVATLLREEHGE